MNLSFKQLVQVVMLCLCAVVALSPAAAIDLEAIDTGFITATGGSSKFDGVLDAAAEYNYSVGWEKHYDGDGLKPTTPLVYQEKKNYFVFDLGGITPGSVVSADIILPLPTGGYTSMDPAEGFVLSATSLTAGELAILKDPPIVPMGPIPPGDVDPGLIMAAMDFFGVLTEVVDMMGPELGAMSLEAGDAGTDVVITLTAAGIDYLNGGAGGTIVIGGKVESIDPMPFTQELFSFTKPFPLPGMPPFTPTDLPTLSLVTIPIPASLPLLLSAIASVMVWRRRSANA